MKKAAVLLFSWIAGFGLLTATTVHAQLSPRKSVAPPSQSSYGVKDQQEDRKAQRNAWLQGNDRQQEQLTACFRLSATLEQHSRDIRKMTSAAAVNWKDVAGQVEDLQRGVAALSEKHEQFALELNNGQRSWWEKPLQEIMSIQLLLSERMGAIERDVRGEKPEAVPMVKAFTDLEGQFRRWNDTYGRIAADMDIEIEQPRSASGVIRGLPGAQGPGR